MRTKLQNLQQKLSHGMIGREDVIKTALLAMLAGENVLLIGPPGTGKSMVARRVSEALTGENRYFEYLLTKFSTPEELFGPLSISELKNDRFKRNTAGYLPTVQIAFLDEIFKASSSILNSLLTILNERKFHNGTESQSVPLQAVIAASNELPKGQAELSALYDRFLLRRFVDYLDHHKLGELFNLPEAEDLFANECLTPKDLIKLRQQAQKVAFPEEIRQAVQTIWQKHQELFKENADEQLSDRRFVKAVKLMRMSAASNGRKEVDLSDVMLLKDCLWNDEVNAERVAKLILETLKTFDYEIYVEIPAAKSQQKQHKNVISGLQGSGTENDPILINNAEEFGRLEEENIGQQGYYFRQTKDIDFSSWGKKFPVMPLFIGHYDGNGFGLKHNNKKTTLFKEAKDSSIKELKLLDILFSEQYSNCKLHKYSSSSDKERVETYVNCSIDSSRLSKVIIHESNVVNSKIELLEVTDSKIVQSNVKFKFQRYANNLEISNSVIELGLDSISYEHGMENSNVKNCLFLFDNVGNVILRIQQTIRSFGVITFPNPVSTTQIVDAKNNPFKWTTAIINLENSSVISSILGNPNSESMNLNHYSLFNKDKDNRLKEIFCVDNYKNMGRSFVSNSTKIPLARYNQYYLEHTVGWDFEKIWRWDNKTNNPVLQHKPYKEPSYSKKKNHTTSILKQQFKQNIWLD